VHGLYRLIIVYWLVGSFASAADEKPISPYAAVTYVDGFAIFNSESRRPLSGTIFTLANEFNIPLSFEDAPITFRGDYDDITAPSYQPKSEADRLLVPRGGPLTLRFAVTAPHKAPADIRNVLEGLLGSYRRSGYPGVYEVRIIGNVWHIVPAKARSTNGTLSNVTPLMDTPVSLVAVPGRTNEQVLEEMFIQIKKTTGKIIFVGTQVSHNYLEAPSPEAFSGTAREVLERSFEQFGGHALWLLQCTPVSGPCALNLF